MNATPVEEPTMTEAMITDDAIATGTPEPTPATTTTTPPALPPLPGFNLDGVSRNQSYIIRNMLVFADCVAQPSPEAIFDVLARNFPDTGALVWWLWRVGKRDLVGRVKGRDIIDASRITAHALHQQLKSEIGGKLPRW